MKLHISNIESNSNLTVKGVAQLLAGESIKYSEKKCVYAVLSKEECDPDHPYPLCKLSNKLTFTITEIDIDSKEELGAYEDDYALDDLSILVRDYIKPLALPLGTFKDNWDIVGSNINASEVI